MNRLILILFTAVAVSTPTKAEEAKVQAQAQVPVGVGGEVKVQPAAAAEVKPADVPTPAKAEEPKKEDAPKPAAAEGAEKAEEPKKEDAPKPAAAEGAEKAGPSEAEEALKKKIAEQELTIAELKAEVAALTAELGQLRAEKATATGRTATKNKAEIVKLIAMFRERSSERFKARQGLRAIGKQAVPFLIEATKDKHPFTKQTAVQTLGDIEDISAVPTLMDILQGENDDLAAEANRALGKITKRYFGTIGLDETAEEKKQVVDNWKKWWEENKE